MSELHLISVPKWGLSMEEGTIVTWHKQVGDFIIVGDELVDIETTKISNTVEATTEGVLVRILAAPGSVKACGAALGLIGSGAESDQALDTFLSQQELRAAYNNSPDESTPEAPTTMTVTIDGDTRRMRYLDKGIGEMPVVLLHGFGGDLDNWAYTLPALALSQRVIAIDLLGHGGSDKRIGNGSAATLARGVAALLDAIPVGSIHLVGHSFGAMVAREFIALNPSRVATFTAIAPADLAPINRTYIDGFMSARRHSQMSETVGLLFATQNLATRELVENLLRYKRLDGVATALLAIDATNFSAPSPDPAALTLWQNLGTRGLIIWGEADAVVSCIGMEIPDSAVNRLLIAGTGHMPHIEKAYLVSTAILTHLQGDHQ